MRKDQSGRRGPGLGRLLAWGVIAGWLVVAGVAAAPASDLTGAQDNNAATYLPRNAESTQVQDALARQQEAAVTPAVVVYERGPGITAADQGRAAADARAFAAIDGVAGPVDGPLLSADGASLRTIVPVKTGNGGWNQITQAVNRIRDALPVSGSGLSVYVTGPAALTADTSKAFTGLDSALLYTTLAIVVVILLLTYRSPVLWLPPILTVGAALTLAQALVDVLARHAGLTVNAQGSSILTVLVFGAGTDYALLLTARYREELRRHAERRRAMAAALRRATPTIAASAATVTCGMFCLTVATTTSTRGMGPVAAIGILSALVAVLTLMPALLVVAGRWIFWPSIPAYGSADPATAGMWSRLGAGIARRPRAVWLAAAVGLAALACGLAGLHPTGIAAQDAFVNPPGSVLGARALAAHFPAGDGQPVTIVSAPGKASEVHDAVRALPGTAAITAPGRLGDQAIMEVTLDQPADSAPAQADVRHLRDVAHRIDPGAKVGGQTATLIDTNDAARRDLNRIVPLVLLVVLLILAVLLRSVVAPLLLVGTVVLSFAAALGGSALLFDLLGWHSADSSLPLFVFVFLVALGVDYNIFLATRIREDAISTGDTRAAVRTALAATGGVITSAGLVLAGTFAALASLPLIAYAQIGIAIAVGVLIDTTIVRAVLVTALGLDIGRWIWWPGRLACPSPAMTLAQASEPHPTTGGGHRQRRLALRRSVDE
jgi:RND superfamily putative drug exporter